MNKLATILPKVLPPLIVFVAVAVLWQISVSVFAIPAFLLPAPTAIMGEIVDRWPLLMENLQATLIAAVAGFAVGTAVAILLSVLFIYSRTAERALFPWAIIIKTIPVIAIAPLLTIWLGYGLAPKVAISALICFFPTLVNTVKGLRSVSPQQLEFMKILSATQAQTFMQARLYAALPFIFAAAKISISMAVVGAIVAEFTGANTGIGTLIVTAGYQMDATMLFAAIFMSALATVILYYLVIIVESLCLYWPEARIDG
ncbi:MAG: ABC transporter permease [Pseudomonadota bacterium]|nr:ABC transporter permease [Pseudomonadota bacterium]